jgi:hypothetical protein
MSLLYSLLNELKPMCERPLYLRLLSAPRRLLPRLVSRPRSRRRIATRPTSRSAVATRLLALDKHLQHGLLAQVRRSSAPLGTLRASGGAVLIGSRRSARTGRPPGRRPLHGRHLHLIVAVILLLAHPHVVVIAQLQLRRLVMMTCMASPHGYERRVPLALEPALEAPGGPHLPAMILMTAGVCLEIMRSTLPSKSTTIASPFELSAMGPGRRSRSCSCLMCCLF